jgi:hypothetical protein
LRMRLSKKFFVVGAIIVAALAIACSNQVGSSGLNNPLNATDVDSFVADTGPGPIAITEPDPQYQQKLESPSIHTGG